VTETTLTLTPEQIEEHARVLAAEADRERLAGAAMTLASAGQSQAAEALGRWLTVPDFWARLDVLDDPDLKTTNLAAVLGAMAKHPTRANEPLALALLADEGFLSDSDRAGFVLPVLAAARPMSETAAALLRRTNDEGYRNSNGPLLVANGSPRAMAVFVEMVADRGVPAEDRVDMIRWSVPTHRGDPGVLDALAPLVDGRLEPEVDRALLETLFDYQGDDWYGVARFPPVPPSWSAVDTSVLGRFLDLGFRLAQTRGLPDDLKATIESTLEDIRKELAARWT
jgi:hypothetical protein